MRKLPQLSVIVAAVLAVSGCASNGGSRDEGDYMGPVYPVSGMYYGHGYYDYYDDYPDYIVTPQPPENIPERPGIGDPRPTHPIALPPGERPNRPDRPTSRPSQRPSSMSHQRVRASPSIPSRSRPMGGRRGGGGRRR
ncbi:MAG TPA: hypothetical protein VIV27_09910 [Halioglobus sp.]